MGFYAHLTAIPITATAITAIPTPGIPKMAVSTVNPKDLDKIFSKKPIYNKNGWVSHQTGITISVECSDDVRCLLHKLK